HWWIHGLPFLFGLIDIIPYVLVGADEKQAFLTDVTHNISLTVEHNYGFIHQQWHYIVKLILSVIYLLAQWGLLFTADAVGYNYKPRQRVTLYSITVFFSLFIILQIGMVLNLLFNR